MKGEKISYEINNFSEKYKTKDFVNFYIKNSKISCKSKDKKEYNIPKKTIGCYFLYNKKNELIYIGRAVCVFHRLVTHLVYDANQISGFCDDLYKIRHTEKQKECYYFAYSIIEKEYLDAVERFLINKYKPKYNIQSKIVC
jgi:excinuclease UvrABC nuclease subunit